MPGGLGPRKIFFPCDEIPIALRDELCIIPEAARLAVLENANAQFEVILVVDRLRRGFDF